MLSEIAKQPNLELKQVVQFTLNQWKKANGNQLDELALLESVRSLLAHPGLQAEAFDIVSEETDILSVISVVLRRSDSYEQDFVALMKNKALNICVNLLMGSDSTVKDVL